MYVRLILLVGCLMGCGSDDAGLFGLADAAQDAKEATCEPEACGAAGCCEDGCCANANPISNQTDVGPLPDADNTIGVPNRTEFSTDDHCTDKSALGDCAPITITGGGDVCVCSAGNYLFNELSIVGSRGLVLKAKTTITGTLLTIAPGAGGQENASTNRAGGTFSGDASLVPLVGGTAGGNACHGNGGGKGGGALQLSAGESIDIATIHAPGGGGHEGNPNQCSPGAGGGSGGAILVEAPSVTLSQDIIAGGGGGGGAGNNNDGWGSVGGTGRLTGTAPGGSGADGRGCRLYGYTYGGDGGRGAWGMHKATAGQSSDSVSGCLGGTAYVGSGGGGGGLGAIRVNTTSGCACTGNFSPAPSLGTLNWN